MKLALETLETSPPCTLELQLNCVLNQEEECTILNKEEECTVLNSKCSADAIDQSPPDHNTLETDAIYCSNKDCTVDTVANNAKGNRVHFS